MNNRIHRSNFTDQVAAYLADAIRTHTYKPGDRLPSVEKLAAELGVGRSTVREGVRLLQAQGLLEVVHGVGIFVAKERITRTAGLTFSFSDTILERGMQPHSQILHQEKGTADDETAAKLQITIGDAVNILKRLRFADDLPMAVETSISAYARFPDVLEQDWNGKASLYAFLRDRYHVHVHAATQMVRSVAAGITHSKQLLIQPKSPVLLVETVAYDKHNQPIEFGRSYYRADRYEYRVQLTQG